MKTIQKQKTARDVQWHDFHSELHESRSVDVDSRDTGRVPKKELALSGIGGVSGLIFCTS